MSQAEKGHFQAELMAIRFALIKSANLPDALERMEAEAEAFRRTEALLERLGG